jgi:O-antigen/teichoic acid export membrane protein
MSISNTASNLLIRVSSIGTQLALVPIAITTVGKDAYGLWMVSISIANILIALDLGSMNAAFNIAARNFNHRVVDLCAFAAARRAGKMMLCLFLLTTILVMNLDIATLLHTQQSNIYARTLLLMVCSISLLTVPFAVFNQRRLARLQAFTMAPILILGNLFGLAAAWGVSQIDSSAYFFYAAALLPPMLSQVWIALSLGEKAGSLPKRWLTAPLNRANRRIRKESSHFFVIQIAALGSFNIDNLIIAVMLSSSEAAEFALANRYFSVIAILLSVYLATAWPMYASIMRHNQVKLMKLFWRNMFLSIAFATTTAAILFSIRRPFFDAWTRGAVLPSTNLMVAFALLSIVNAALGNVSALQNATSQLKVQAIVASFMLMPNLLLSVSLVPHMGSAGTVLASILCAIVMLVIYAYSWTWKNSQGNSPL